MNLAFNGTTIKQVQKSVVANNSDTVELNECWIVAAGPLVVLLQAQNFAATTWATVNDSSFSKLDVVVSPA
jgi:hypothetical protein